MSPTGLNALMMAAEAFVYFAVLAGLFRARGRLGIGTFFCALGVMHFLETYLATILYISLPFGIAASPGSVVLFTGKLMLLLLVYIREDAVVVRQPIYGLLLGNVLLLALAALMRWHGIGVLAGHAADFAFLDQMGALMVWGTLILFADCIMMILLYEKLRPVFGRHLLPRLMLTGALILTFDQGAFFTGLHYLTGAPLSVLFGGWAAKMAAVALYAVLGTVYLRHVELARRRDKAAPRVRDVFDLLTYRERYEDLMARSGRDALTGALDRGRLEHEGRKRVAAAALSGRPVSLFILDIDHFKSFNDRFGHTAGDVVLLRIARIVMATVGIDDAVFRFGGEEFVVIVPDLARAAAQTLGEKIRRDVASHMDADAAAPLVTVSIGFATCADDASDYDGLFECADRRLYLAKSAGRNRVIGGDEESREPLATPLPMRA